MFLLQGLEKYRMSVGSMLEKSVDINIKDSAVTFWDETSKVNENICTRQPTFLQANARISINQCTCTMHMHITLQTLDPYFIDTNFMHIDSITSNDKVDSMPTKHRVGITLNPLVSIARSKTRKCEFNPG